MSTQIQNNTTGLEDILAKVNSLPEGGTSGGGTSGEDGGYYIPSVDTAGNLSWTASKGGMESIPSANIKGPKGDTGEKGE